MIGQNGSNLTKILLVILAGLTLAALSLLMAGVSQINRANALEELLKQDEQTYVNRLETLTRIVSGQYKLAEQYPGQLRSVVQQLAQGRQGGTGLKAISEQNSGVFDVSLLRSVQQTVTTQRTEFDAAFRQYADHARELNTLIRHPIWGWFLTGRKLAYPEPIISERTSEAQTSRRAQREDWDSSLDAREAP